MRHEARKNLVYKVFVGISRPYQNPAGWKEGQGRGDVRAVSRFKSVCKTGEIIFDVIDVFAVGVGQDVEVDPEGQLCGLYHIADPKSDETGGVAKSADPPHNATRHAVDLLYALSVKQHVSRLENLEGDFKSVLQPAEDKRRKLFGLVGRPRKGNIAQVLYFLLREAHAKVETRHHVFHIRYGNSKSAYKGVLFVFACAFNICGIPGGAAGLFGLFRGVL